MTAFALPYTLHVLAALVWVGGMFFAWMVLRPATVAALDGPARLRLWVEVFRRFFGWMLQNSPTVASYMHLPPNRVIELGAQVAI